MNYEKMSIPQLEAEINNLNAEMEGTRERKREVARILDGKIVLEGALRKAAAMSDAERTALAKVLRPEGIESQEQVGVIGRLLDAFRK